MIACVKGILIGTGEASCVVLTAAGVGYEIALTVPAAASLPATGNEVEFFTATIVREDALDLYGFTSWEERCIFLILLSISKLGPKTACNMLAAFSPADLRRIVLSDDYMPLTSVSGIGKKSAQRIFIELQHKLETTDTDTLPPISGPDGQAAGIFRDALTGLTNLGYEEHQARMVLESVFAKEPGLDVSQALREALKAISQAKKSSSGGP